MWPSFKCFMCHLKSTNLHKMFVTNCDYLNVFFNSDLKLLSFISSSSISDIVPDVSSEMISPPIQSSHPIIYFIATFSPTTTKSLNIELFLDAETPARALMHDSFSTFKHPYNPMAYIPHTKCVGKARIRNWIMAYIYVLGAKESENTCFLICLLFVWCPVSLAHFFSTN